MRRLCFAVALVAAAAAHAEDVVYGPDGAPTVVQRKLHTMTGRWELGLSGAVATNTSLVDSWGAILSVTNHPNEWLDFGGEGLVNYTQLSALSDNIRADLRTPRVKTPFRDELANASQVRAAAFGMARLAPIYGKLNLASELKIHFQAYALAGAGAGYVHHESVNLCGVAGTQGCPAGAFQTADSVKAMGEAGLGMRFYAGERWSVRAEMRSLLFPDSYKEGNDLTNPASGTQRNYLGLVVLFVAGASVTF